MSSIKPPSGPKTPGVQGPESADRASPTGTTRGPDFKEQLGTGAAGTKTPTPPTNPSQAVIADLRAGRITPDQAVQRLSDIAVTRSGATPEQRPAVEARVRELRSRDPLVRDLLRQMGASVPPSSDE